MFKRIRRYFKQEEEERQAEKRKIDVILDDTAQINSKVSRLESAVEAMHKHLLAVQQEAAEAKQRRKAPKNENVVSFDGVTGSTQANG